MTPIVAALTMLSKFQNDVKSSENKVIEFCLSRLAIEVVFDSYNSIVGSKRNIPYGWSGIGNNRWPCAFNSQKNLLLL